MLGHVGRCAAAPIHLVMCATSDRPRRSGCTRRMTLLVSTETIHEIMMASPPLSLITLTHATSFSLQRFSYLVTGQAGAAAQGRRHHRRQLAEGAGVRDHLLAPPHRHRRRLVRLGLCLLRQQALPGHLHQDHPPQRGLRVGEVLGLRSPPCISACAHTYLPCVETPSCFADK